MSLKSLPFPYVNTILCFLSDYELNYFELSQLNELPSQIMNDINNEIPLRCLNENDFFLDEDVSTATSVEQVKSHHIHFVNFQI